MAQKKKNESQNGRVIGNGRETTGQDHVVRDANLARKNFGAGSFILIPIFSSTRFGLLFGKLHRLRQSCSIRTLTDTI